MFCEIHFHTAETSHCGRVAAAEGIAKYKAHGYDALVVTDHLCKSYFDAYYNGELDWEESIALWLKGYKAARLAGEKSGIKVFLGCELSFEHLPTNDYLVYGISEDMLYSCKELWRMNECEFKQFADSNGLFVAQAHPFRPHCSLCPSEYLHGVEIFNAHFKHQNDNHRAIELWHNSGLIPTCGTDHHDPNAVLGCGMLFDRPAENERDIAKMLHSRAFKLVIPNCYP